MLVVVELGVAGGVLVDPSFPCGEDPSSIRLIFRAPAPVTAVSGVLRGDLKAAWTFVEGEPLTLREGGLRFIVTWRPTWSGKTSWKRTLLTASFEGGVSKSSSCGAKAGQ